MPFVHGLRVHDSPSACKFLLILLQNSRSVAFWLQFHSVLYLFEYVRLIKAVVTAQREGAGTITAAFSYCVL